jgi:Cysteine-rich CWC
MTDPASAAEPGAGEALETCPECGARFRCGAVAGQTDCWCRSLPPRLPVPADPQARCLCPDCLARLLTELAV